jgi:hypothetical protein
MEKLKRHETQKKIQNCKKNTKNNSAPREYCGDINTIGMFINHNGYNMCIVT